MKNRNKQPSVDLQPSLSIHMPRRLREGLLLLSVACAIFLLIALISYHQSDRSWSSTGLDNKVMNWGGRFGAWIADIFLSLFGFVAYLFPFLIALTSWVGFKEQNQMHQSKEWIFKILGWFLLIISSCALAHFYFQSVGHSPASAGGIIGDLFGRNLSLILNKIGSTLLFLTTLLCGITLVTGLSWLALIDVTGKYLHHCWGFVFTQKVKEKTADIVVFNRTSNDAKTSTAISFINKNPKEFVVTRNDSQRSKKRMDFNSNLQLKPGILPPLDLLNAPSPMALKPFTNISFEDLSHLVEQRLSDFGVEVKVVAVHPGPIITRFELELAPGIKVSKITGLAKDIARSLSTVSVRIVEVIPGKPVIGLEIPNENRELVTLRDILESHRFAQSRSPVSLVLGKDISGNAVVVDLTKMPHLLVAGTTGSGKSVSLNAMLLSMLFKSTPEQLRFILIDPKMLELSVYDGIPHLLTPVITDMKDAANALRWCVAEMDKRYKLMASLGVRNITGYNQKVQEAIKQGQPIPLPHSLVTNSELAKEYLTPLPLIVVIADELADMMMVVGKKVEDLIARIAQKARAAGIHLILATQRPSVDVITGLIKANIPTRIAFQVSSRIDSRTILDQQGAEQLIGHGDMLYLPPGVGVPIRVHGAYVADEEVHRVVAAWRSYGHPNYVYEIIEEGSESGAENSQSGEQDPLYDEAVRIVVENRRASISLVQRRLRIGYNRAARMMEEMEKAGLVSSMDNNGTREVLVAQ